MKVVLDTNIFVSSTFWKGPSHKVVEKALDGKIKVFTSIEILQELDKVLRRDFDETDEMVHRQISLILNYATTIPVSVRLSVVKKDPDDNKILECAVSCAADYIITNDRHLLDLKEYQGIQIVTPKQFLEI